MIKLESLNLILNGEHILKDITLHIKSGEFVLLKGVSGSGKTSLLSIISTLQKPTSGKVLIDEQVVSKLPDLHISNFRLNSVGIVFQDFNLIDYLSVEDNILSALIPTKISKKEAKAKVEKALNLANISHKAKANIKDLSGGEKQRVAIARALVNDAKILICDEPTANLDTKNSLQFIKLLKELNGLGKTIIVATHDTIFEENGNFRVVNVRDGEIL